MTDHAAKEEFSRIWSLDGEQYQRHPHRRTHEWFCIEWRIDRLNILHRSGVMFFSTKIQDVGCCHLNLCYARKFWCRMTSYAYTSYLAQIFLTVPEIVGCHSHSIYAKILHHPRKLSGDPYLVTKFRTDPIFRFEINGEFNFSPVLGYLTPKVECSINEAPKAHPCVIPRRLSHQTRNPLTGLTCRWVPEKGYKLISKYNFRYI